MRPNIFKFATSELSQDAFICYVLDYYNANWKTKHVLEHKFAKFFIHNLFKKLSIDNIEINSLEIKKQFMAIDILLIINENIYIIIEDKTFTSERENQMNGYREKVIKNLKALEQNVYCIYYKTGDESYTNTSLIGDRKNIETLLREEIIEIFEKYEGSNILFEDYLTNLKDFQNERENFKNRNLKKEIFTWNEIIGFYNELDKAFVKLKSVEKMPKDIGFNWQYVANQNGGFMCYYFQNILDFEDYGYYLQLESIWKKDKNIHENMKFTFKIWSDNKDISLLYKGLDILKENYGNKIQKPSRFARGTWMTQAIIKDYIVINEIGIIDVDKTAINIVTWLKSLRDLKSKLKFSKDDEKIKNS
ncbi:MAG: PD-(D/E)XK nuclease family protein [Cetobacterium sp.]